MRVASLLLISSLVVTPAFWALGADETSLEELVVRSANTPEEHQALAAYFRGKAEDARKDAEHHRAMSRAYTGVKAAEQARMAEHCIKLVSAQEALAKEYDGLAALHDAQAKKK